MIDKSQLTGAILAGGQARRMQSLAQQSGQGQKQNEAIDKGLVHLAGRPLVAWQQELLQPAVNELIINANQNLERYAAYGRVVPDDDDLPAGQGPLIGLLSVLRHSRTPWVVAVPVDSPFLPADFIDRLGQAQQQHPACRLFYCRAERDYPLCLLAHVEAASGLADYIQAQGRRVMPWLGQYEAVAVEFGPQAAAAFTNINTPRDLEDAAHLLAGQHGGQDSS